LRFRAYISECSIGIGISIGKKSLTNSEMIIQATERRAGLRSSSLALTLKSIPGLLLYFIIWAWDESRREIPLFGGIGLVNGIFEDSI
jgi:hypothetical protein